MAVDDQCSRTDFIVFFLIYGFICPLKNIVDAVIKR